MMKLVLIMLGGAAGTGLRYLVTGWVQRAAEGSFPFGTLVVNVVGCLVIGVLGSFFAGPSLVRDEYRLMLLVGVLGGFTTFSSFGYETLALLNDGQFGRAAANVLAHNTLGLGAVWFGYRLTERLIGA